MPWGSRRRAPPASRSPSTTDRLPDADLLQPLIDLLLQLRARRTPEGWEVADQSMDDNPGSSWRRGSA